MEVTHTHRHKLKTGIQRVVRKIAFELSEAALRTGNDFQLIVADPASAETPVPLETQEFLTGRPKHVRPASPNLVFESKRYSAFRGLWRFIKRIDFLNLLSSRFLRTIAERVIALLFMSEVRKLNNDTSASFEFKDGDVVLFADAFWGEPYSSLSMAIRAKKSGAKAIFLINDIFPISHVEFVDPPNRVDFEECLPRALNIADGILYPSNETKMELEKHCFTSGIDVPHAKVFYGADLDETSWIYEGAKRAPNSIVMVGTVEPRKNYRLVLKWFLSQADPKVSLTIIGKDGWLNEELAEAMDRESKVNKKFRWIKNASDSDIVYEMLHHEIGLFASHAEGLGLPVLEYNRFGLKLVLNDVPIFREVAGDSATYFNGSSVESLDRAIRRAFQLREVNSIPNVAWSDTAEEILEFLLTNYHKQTNEVL